MENQQQASAIMKHKIGTNEEWLAARVKLLKAEKELTRQTDEVAKQRQNLPWVKIDKEYMFEMEEGTVPFASLFKGRSQLMIYHFMFGPDYTAGCPHCSAIADGFNGVWLHLANHDVTLSAVSRAPLPKLQAFKQRMNWTFPWASSYNSDFNYDFHVSFNEAQQQSGDLDYNYNKGNVSSKSSKIEKTDKAPESGKEIANTVGVDWTNYTKEAPGMSSFIMEDGVIYHTYSAYARGLDALWSIYQWLDRAPLGRNESGFWMKRHDEYENGKNGSEVKSCCS